MQFVFPNDGSPAISLEKSPEECWAFYRCSRSINTQHEEIECSGCQTGNIEHSPCLTQTWMYSEIFQFSFQTTNVTFDADSMSNNTKVITITSDLLSQHQLGTSDQNGSLTNLTVKFHMDESGNVQVTKLISFECVKSRKKSLICWAKYSVAILSLLNTLTNLADFTVIVQNFKISKFQKNFKKKFQKKIQNFTFFNLATLY